jgi:ATP-dependent DNA helicase RecG
LWNVGKLPDEIKIEDLKKSHPSRPRNELIADVFFKAGLIEAWGRGTTMITDSLKKAELPEPEFREEFGGFSVYFYKDIYTEVNLLKMGLNERQIKAVMYIKERRKITNKEYRDITGLSDEGARIDLNELGKKGLFQIKGKGRNTYYVFKTLGD